VLYRFSSNENRAFTCACSNFGFAGDDGAGCEDAAGFDCEASSGAGGSGRTPNGWPWCSIARVKGRFGRRASLGQRVRRRVYCFAIYELSDDRK
jgi:hypothetical protein